ncbi:hypothetical protein [Ferrovum sp.]|uniref:hypothetical protein n=1 Tax=Ferrovum sp. TaxID=2609467 RepID=UPI002631328B|nr:hypothetical protein [Ferrovum sp.]
MENDKPTTITTDPTQTVIHKPGMAFTIAVWGIGLLVMLAIGVTIWSGLRHNGLASTPSTGVQVKGVVAIDSARIFNQRIKNFMQHDAANGDKQKTLDAARDFGQRFHDIVDGYRKHGYLVINARAILAGPEGIDKTQEVAGKMGITLDPIDVNQ